MSNYSCSYYGGGGFNMKNLRAEIRNLQSAQKSFFADDENISQFTTKYFNYDQHPPKDSRCQSKEATKVINFQE